MQLFHLLVCNSNLIININSLFRLYISIVSELDAIQSLEEHLGNLNEAVNAHFGGRDRTTLDTSVSASRDDLMDIEDTFLVAPHRTHFSPLPSTQDMNPSSLLDPNSTRSVFDTGTDFASSPPFLSHPREVRQIPFEIKNGNEKVDNEDIHTAPFACAAAQNEGKNVLTDYLYPTHSQPSSSGIDDLPEYTNDIEEEMLQAAIEASKRDAEIGYLKMHSHLEDADLACVLSLSLKTAKQEKSICELGREVGPSYKSAEEEVLGKLASPSRRFEPGSSSVRDEHEDVEEQPVIRHRSRQVLPGSVDKKEIGKSEVSPPSIPQQPIDHPQHSEVDFHLDEWGGISSEEHVEAIMLEAALFGGIPEGNGYHLPYAPHQLMQNGLDQTVGPYPRLMPRPSPPSLTAQRLILEQEDDVHLALRVDREKELKAREEAEIRSVEEQAAREAVLAEERRRDEESRKKLEEEQDIERQLAAKEACLPNEPLCEDENAVTLLVRIPDGSRQGRRFLKSHRLQYLFDFIDIGRVVKPGTYRLVRMYPRRAFSDGDSALTLNEVGLSSKQEALFLELIN